MKTVLDIGLDVYRHIEAHPLLVGSYAGRLILQQERTEQGEDVVVSVLATDTSTDVQTAYVSVNVYVADSSEGQANTVRLHELSGLFAGALRLFYGSGYRAELREQRIIKAEGRGEHAIHCRLYYQHINE